MLGYGMGAVADIHTHTTTSGAISQSDANSHSHVEVQTDKDSLNDHCSHAGTHMIGLLDGFSIHIRRNPLGLFSPVNTLAIPDFARSLLRPPQFS